MNCEQCRNEVLDAEPLRLQQALAGSPADEFAQHVTSCAACRADVQAIVASQAGLADALAELTACARGPVPRAGARRTFWRMAIPATLAATIAAVALLRSGQETPPRELAVDATQPVVVNVTPDRNVTIFKTADPKITIIWYY